MPNTQPSTQKSILTFFGKKSQKISCKTFHRKNCKFCEFVSNLLSKIVERVHFNSKYVYHNLKVSQRRIQNPLKISKIETFSKIVNNWKLYYFWKKLHQKLHLRCLTGFWMRLCRLPSMLVWLHKVSQKRKVLIYLNMAKWTKQLYFLTWCHISH